MSESVTISKDKPVNEVLDFELLREEGLKHIENLGSNLWTDYNIHDPGITILEALCYAITDVGYRTNFKINDLLAESEGSASGSQFFTANEILRCNAVTENDFRKILIDLDKVKNAWLEIDAKNDPEVYSVCPESRLDFIENIPESTQHREILLNGLYNVLIEIDNDLVLSSSEKELLIEAIKKQLHKYRNLCEDFVNVEFIKIDGIGVCADIEISTDGIVEDIEAEIYFKIYSFLSPSVNFYSLEEMIKSGKTVDEIFEGPGLTNGFIDDDELENSKLPEEIHVSDLYQVIMDVPGVKAVRKLLLTNYPEDIADGAIQYKNEKWVLPLNSRHKPLLDLDKTVINFYKGILPYTSDNDKVLEKFELLKFIDQKSKMVDDVRDLEIPKGTYKELTDYTSVQEEFPLVYGIGEAGLPDSADDLRKAQAKQLKGFLMFYDQILVNYLAQLSNVKNLLSVNNTDDATYFAQPLLDVSDIKDLLKDYDVSIDWDTFKSDPSNNHILNLNKILEDNTTRNDRRNRFLNHLIARFGERFTDYALLMYNLFGVKSNDEIISDKEDFLASYPAISYNRGKAFNYKALKEDGITPDIWDNTNVSGLEARVAKLLGIQNFKRQTLTCDPVYKISVDDHVVSGSTKYFVTIKSKTNKKLLKSSKEYSTYAKAETLMNKLKNLLFYKENYIVKKIAEEEYQLQLLDEAENKVAESEIFDKIEKASDLKYEVWENVCPEKACNKEGFHLIEHILLRPKDTNYDLLPIDIKCDSCDEEFDPYSFRITVVLPYWPERFKKREFRYFFEQTLRQENPAHIGVKICWVDCFQMHQFETAFQNWLAENAKPTSLQNATLLRDYTNTLIDILFKLKNVYPKATLYDCSSADNPVILGYTSLGQY
jgi:uncharacterized protein